MSIHVSGICIKHKLGSATKKHVMMFLADKASDDGSGIWCSKKSIAKFTELNISTVKRTIKEFVEDGLIIQTGQRPNSHGFTIEYSIDLGAISHLESLVRTESTTHPVQIAPPSEVTDPRQEVSSGTPNLPTTINQPSLAEENLEEFFELVLDAYPNHALRSCKWCLAEFKTAVLEGHSPGEILSAVQSYAIKTKNYSRDKVKYSDNWFRGRCWSTFVLENRQKAKDAEIALEGSLARCVRWVQTCDPLCRVITKEQLRRMLDRKLITETQARVAGLIP